MALTPKLGGIAVAMANRNYRIYTIGAIPSLMGDLGPAYGGWLACLGTYGLGCMARLDRLCGPGTGSFVRPYRGGVRGPRRPPESGTLGPVHVIASGGKSLATLTLSSVMTIELLFMLALIQGIVQGIHQPFRHALLGTIVTRAEMTAATESIRPYGTPPG